MTILINARVRYRDYLGMLQEGRVIECMGSDDISAPYLFIRDNKNENNRLVYNGIPYADVRKSSECELISER